jgi:protocatechuate 3,4-dioxygenase alpha subunit
MKGYKMSSLNNIYDNTPFQTAGPFLHIGCLPNSIGIKNIFKHDLGMVPFDRKENADFISISGSVFDGSGQALDDVMLESWQCDESGQFSSRQGFARFAPNNKTKKYNLKTVKPGSVKNSDGTIQSPHILISISSRGINMSLNTRIYFEGDDISNDPLLSFVKDDDKVNTLIAKKVDAYNYNFDIYLQGDKETVFLDI